MQLISDNLREMQHGKILYKISHFKQYFKIPGNTSRFLEHL